MGRVSRDRVLFDSPIIIDALLGLAPAVALLDEYPDRSISVISWIEVLAGVDSSGTAATTLFLRSFGRVELSEAVANASVEARRSVRLKLPDAIILASARVEKRVLLTRDAKDFGGLASDEVRFPYRL